ncbi:MAG: RICIN domain-containing protein [Pirellulaceae bacterium]
MLLKRCLKTLAMVGWMVLVAEISLGEDKIATRLEKARETYQEKIEGLAKQIQSKIDAAKAQATKLGNKAMLDVLENDEKLFREAGSIPFLVATPDLIEKRDQARQALLQVLNKSVSDYTKAKNRFSAAAIERELEETKQRFIQTTSAGITGEGEYRLTHLATGLCLATEVEKNRLLLLPSSDAPTHRWRINKRSDLGPYTLENVKNGMLVNVPHNSKQENLALILWGNQNGADNEIWGIRGEGSVVQFLSKNQMAISIANPAPNSEIIQVNPQATPEQLWIIKRLKDR